MERYQWEAAVREHQAAAHVLRAAARRLLDQKGGDRGQREAMAIDLRILAIFCKEVAARLEAS